MRLLTISGKINIKELQAFFKAYDHQVNTKIKPVIDIVKESKTLVKKVEVLSDDVQFSKLMLGIKLDPIGRSDQALVKREMSMTMCLNMLLGSSSKMYESLLQQKIINQSFYVNTTFEKKAEHIMIYAESKKIGKLKNILINYLTKEAYEDLNEKDFERYKKVYLGQFIFALNSIETKTYLYNKYYHQKTSLFEVVDMMNDVTYEDMLNALKRIKKRSITTLILKKD
jgi:hypothetical protein